MNVKYLIVLVSCMVLMITGCGKESEPVEGQEMTGEMIKERDINALIQQADIRDAGQKEQIRDDISTAYDVFVDLSANNKLHVNLKDAIVLKSHPGPVFSEFEVLEDSIVVTDDNFARVMQFDMQGEQIEDLVPHDVFELFFPGRIFDAGGWLLVNSPYNTVIYNKDNSEIELIAREEMSHSMTWHKGLLVATIMNEVDYTGPYTLHWYEEETGLPVERGFFTELPEAVIMQKHQLSQQYFLPSVLKFATNGSDTYIYNSLNPMVFGKIVDADGNRIIEEIRFNTPLADIHSDFLESGLPGQQEATSFEIIADLEIVDDTFLTLYQNYKFSLAKAWIIVQKPDEEATIHELLFEPEPGDREYIKVLKLDIAVVTHDSAELWMLLSHSDIDTIGAIQYSVAKVKLPLTD